MTANNHVPDDEDEELEEEALEDEEEFDDDEDDEFDDDDEDDDEDDDDGFELDEQMQRIEAQLGGIEDFDAAVTWFYEHLRRSLKLPCEVTGREDFRWEEPYVFGPGNRKEYEQLKKSQPSFRDRFKLLEIGPPDESEWMMCPDEDLIALVQRISDGKKFTLGLAELKLVDEQSPNAQLIDDYAVYFWNYR